MEYFQSVDILGIQSVVADWEQLEHVPKASDLSYDAVRVLIEQLKIDKEEIRVLLFVTQSSDYLIPSTASLLQKRTEIGLDCLVFDVNAGGDGFGLGLQVAQNLLSTMEPDSKGVIVFGECAKEKQLSFASAVVVTTRECDRIQSMSNIIPNTYHLIEQREKYKTTVYKEEYTKCVSDYIKDSKWLEKVISMVDDDGALISNEQWIFDELKNKYKIIEIDDMVQKDSSAFIPYQICKNELRGNVIVATVGAGISLNAFKIFLPNEIYLNIYKSKEYYNDIKEDEE